MIGFLLDMIGRHVCHYGQFAKLFFKRDDSSVGI